MLLGIADRIKRKLFAADRAVDALCRHGISRNDVTLSPDRRRCTLHMLGITVELPRCQYLIEGYNYARRLRETCGATFAVGADGNILADVGGVRVNVRTWEELLILHEIHVAGIYNFFTPGKTIVWDIGMNVGFASLYFATMPDTIVEAFELFPQTLAAARANLALNPEAATKISSHNIGIARGDGRRAVEFSEKFPGSSGLFDLQDQVRRQSEVVRQEIDTADASRVLRELAATHPDRSVVAKIDCEGAEYEIIESLVAGGNLRDLRLIMLEWHRRGPGQDPRTLVETLKGTGFSGIFTSPLDGDIGMIYALNPAAH